MAKAVAQGEPLVLFQAGFAAAEVGAVADWLAALSTEAPALLAKLPRVTWTQAIEHSRRWHDRLARQNADVVSAAALGQGVVIALEMADGWRWARLETTAALDAEGQAMGHCVGSGGYDGLAGCFGPDGIYSLRDAKGRPHVTVDGGAERAEAVAEGPARPHLPFEGRSSYSAEFTAKAGERPTAVPTPSTPVPLCARRVPFHFYLCRPMALAFLWGRTSRALLEDLSGVSRPWVCPQGWRIWGV